MTGTRAMGFSSQWWKHHGRLLSESTALKHDLVRNTATVCSPRRPVLR
jgi:hypothetical protein